MTAVLEATAAPPAETTRGAFRSFLRHRMGMIGAAFGLVTAAAGIAMDARRTISTMCAEVSAEFALWEPDAVLMVSDATRELSVTELNLLLHAGNAVVLFLFLRRLFQLALPADACRAVYADRATYGESMENLERWPAERDFMFGPRLTG